MKQRGELAPPVEVPRWICFFGTQLVVVAAASEAHARAIIRWQEGGLIDRRISHHAREIRVRQLRVSDADLIASWERAHEHLKPGKALDQGTKSAARVT